MLDMSKRILFTFFTLLVLYSAILVGYRVFEPQQDDALDNSTQDVLDYDVLKEYTLSTGNATKHYYYFSSSTNADCIYVRDTVIKAASQTAGLNLDEYIEEVDITELEQNFAINRLKTEWDVASYPAFVACRVENQEIVIENKLEWNPQQPISADNLLDWLALNKLVDIDATDAPIETPAS